MRSLLNRFPKWITFGLVGILGGLALALFAERWVGARRDEVVIIPEDLRTVELVFVLDTSGSMSGEIEGVRNSLTEFLEQLEAKKIKGRFALVTFNSGAKVEHPPTADVREIVAAMKPLFVKGGRPTGDSSLAGLALAASLPFQAGSRRVVVLVTDETFDIPDGEIFSTAEVVSRLKAASIDEVDTVTLASLASDYSFLAEAAPGKVFTMDRYGRQSEGLSGLFKEVAVSIADSSVLRGSGAPGAKVDAAAIKKNFWPNALQVGLWVALVSFGIGAGVEATQQLMLGGALRPWPILRAMAISALLGFASGIIAQSLYAWTLGSIKGFDQVPRAISWVFVGAGLGFSISLAIPNLGSLRAMLLGGLGGLFAVGGFLLVSLVGSEMFSRLMGASFLGLFIALGVTIAEAVAREAFLVIHWAPNETTTVNLGSRPVVVGTSRDSSVRLSPKTGYPPEVATFQLKDGKATMVNHMSRTSHVLKDGNKLALGTVVVEVRILSGSLTAARP